MLIRQDLHHFSKMIEIFLDQSLSSIQVSFLALIVTPSSAGLAKLTRVNKRSLDRTRVVSATHALQPSSPVERPNCIDHISYPARRPSQRQLKCHVTPRKSAMSR
ncbi:hypothetical protein CR513_33984, partial [Mucuna pruriens]